MSDELHHPLTHPCPACGQPVEIPTEISGAPLQCAACGEQFIIDDEPPEPEVDLPPTSEDHLDLARMMRISKLRRATQRSRSHAIVAACVCGVAVVQLVIWIVRDAIHVGWTWRIALNSFLAIIALMGGQFFIRRVKELGREI